MLASCLLILFYKNITNARKSPLVSVIIPVYNSSEFLSSCLDSIINQTYTDMEIICVNDGSKDNSLEILNQYKNKDKRIIVIDKQNGGVSSARNVGLKTSKGKYVQFVDSDDLINCETFKNLVFEAEKFNADIVNFNKTWFINDEHPNIQKKPEYSIEDSEHYFHHETEDPFTKKLNLDVIHNKFYKREFLIKNDLFFEENIHLGEDSLFCFMSFIRTNVIVNDKNVYYYHRKGIETSLMGSATKQKWFDNRVLMLDYLIKHQNKFKFDDYKQWILERVISYGSLALDFDSNEEKSENAERFFNVADNFINDKELIISAENKEKIQKIKDLIK